MAVHEHRYKRTAEANARQLRARGLEAQVKKTETGYCVYSYRK